MSERIYTDRIYPLEWGNNRMYPSFPAVVAPMAVGGSEGEKYAVMMQHPLRRDDAHALHFIAKDYLSLSSRAQRDLEQSVSMYRDLHRHGYPVPERVSRFAYNDRGYLAMSDMREGGLYRLWGYNDPNTTTEMEELVAMNLSAENLEDAKGKILTIAKKATQEGYAFEWFNYHIRKHTKTNAVDIVLLDVCATSYKNGLSTKNNENEVEGLIFFHELSKTINT